MPVGFCFLARKALAGPLINMESTLCLPAQEIAAEVGSAIFFGGALSLECYLFLTSASARSQQFQICQCAKRYSAIAEASARRYPAPTPRGAESEG
jgi:hypothetical protein